MQKRLKNFLIDRFIYVLVIAALIALWSVVLVFTYFERDLTIERTAEQLTATVITLADFNELAEQTAEDADILGSDTRTAAIWRALLQYPSASIWVESGGEIIGGQPALNPDASILVGEQRTNFTVYAAMPEDAALADWERAFQQRIIILSAVSLAFMAMAFLLVRSLHQRTVAEAQITEMARTDALTGLANRATFLERLDQVFAATNRGARPFAILYLDLDHFKTINDTLGHPIGDELLKSVAERLTNCTRETDVVARLGGDEFAILQTDIYEPANAGSLAESIQKTINKPYSIEGNELHISCSIGICPFSIDSDTPDRMLAQADLALYRSKEEGRNRYHFHSLDLDKQVQERSALSEALRVAIDEEQLELDYQPQVTVGEKKIAGMEALVRWNHPQKGKLEAKEFIYIAEQTGMIMMLGHWVLDTACRQLRDWKKAGITLNRLNLNLSEIQLKNGAELISDIIETTEKYGLQPEDLEFDVTEAMLARVTFTQNDIVSRLRELGCHIAVDNFGQEYSSLQYLVSYSVDKLKISRTLIEQAVENPKWNTIIQAIIQLAEDMNLGIVAEGIENEKLHGLLMKIGEHTQGQGYYYSHAVDAATATGLLHQGHVSEPTMPAGRKVGKS